MVRGFCLVDGAQCLTKTTLTNANFDDAATQRTVDLLWNGAQRTVRPEHVVFCSGHAGGPMVPSFPGQPEFRGQVYHTSQHEEASRSNVKGKKVVGVGTGHCGHDTAEDYYENGAEVTMLQRRGTFVLSLDRGVLMLHEGMHSDNG